MNTIRRLVVFVLLSVPFFATAKEQATQIIANKVEQDYAVVTPQGGLTVKTAWQGLEIDRLDDGSCVEVVHTHLTIVPDGAGQKPQYEEYHSPVDCELVAALFNPHRTDEQNKLIQKSAEDVSHIEQAVRQISP